MMNMIELTGLIILYLYGVLDINFVTVLPGTIMFRFDYMISYCNNLPYKTGFAKFGLGSFLERNRKLCNCSNVVPKIPVNHLGVVI